jgi:transcriptional regulator with XRE-family HTH domain
MAIGLTQDRLAKALGITFQQIQKYEKGANRIGASRLQAISRILNAPVSYFFADASGVLSTKLLEAQSTAAVAQSATPDETLQMVKTFLQRARRTSSTQSAGAC